jgi:hypothetical protein
VTYVSEIEDFRISLLYLEVCKPEQAESMPENQKGLGAICLQAFFYLVAGARFELTTFGL